MNGIARGKILPDEKFLRSLDHRGLRIPESIFVQTVTGEYPEKEDVTDDASIDVYMTPDPASLRPVPWYEEPTAPVIRDCVSAPVGTGERPLPQVLSPVLSINAPQGAR